MKTNLIFVGHITTFVFHQQKKITPLI